MQLVMSPQDFPKVLLDRLYRSALMYTNHTIFKAANQFPVGKIARFIKARGYAERVGVSAPVYLAAVLEYPTAEVSSPPKTSPMTTRRPE